MALSDGDKDVLGWAALVPNFLSVLGDLTGEEGFKSAAEKLSQVPMGQIAEVLGALRTDEVDIATGTMEIGDGVTIEVVDD
jgi:hypothetical protein